MALTQVKAAGLTADLIDETKLADNSIDSEHYNDGSIDHAHLANDCIDGDNIQDDVINSEHYVAASIDHEHLANDCVDGDNIQDDSIGAEHIADNAVGLAAMPHGTDGNLITYDTNGAPAAVATGSSGQVLTSNGSGAAPTFQAAAAGGKVLQVQQVTYNSETVTNGSSWVDIHSTNFKVDITPASTASHFIIHCHINGVTVLGDDVNYAQFRLKGTGSGIDTEEWFGYNIGLNQGESQEYTRGMATASYTYVETAQLNATNAVSFRVQFRGSSSDLDDNVYCAYGGSGASECSIVVMEVSPN